MKPRNKLLFLILLLTSNITGMSVFGAQNILTFDMMKNIHGGVGCNELCNSTAWNCGYCPDGTNVKHCQDGWNQKICQSTQNNYSCIQDPDVNCGAQETCETGSSLHCFNCQVTGTCAPYFQCHTQF